MKRFISSICLLFVSFLCFAEVHIGSYYYQNIMYGNDVLSNYSENSFFPGFNGLEVFGKYIHALDGYELECGVNLGFTGYGPDATIEGGFGKTFFLAENTKNRVSADVLVGVSSFAGGFNMGCKITNEIQQMFNKNFGVGLIIGIQYKNYIFNTQHQNFIDFPLGFELVFK
jgi:hypothetical protein